jgi:hypothetical protein
MRRSATRGNQSWAMGLVTIVLILLAGCSATVPVPADSAAPAAVGAAESTAETSVNATEPQPGTSEPEVSVETLAFSVQQSTFLSHIDAAIAESGQPDEHLYVEFVADDGATWQGERLVYGDGDVLFLQQAASDGLTAVRLDLSSDTGPQTIRAALPTADAPKRDAANVDVQYVRARLSNTDTGVWAFDATVAHPDTGWEDYTDGWHVETADGRILGTRILLHPHVNEQPFTRGLNGVIIPDDVAEVRIRPHDLVAGYGEPTEPIPLGEAGTGNWYEVVR